jgi:hypothetical protein
MVVIDYAAGYTPKEEFEKPEVLSIATECEQHNPEGETDMINEVLTPEIDF